MKLIPSRSDCEAVVDSLQVNPNQERCENEDDRHQVYPNHANCEDDSLLVHPNHGLKPSTRS